MVDHPLVPEDVKSYMQRHNIESILNKGLNEVLKQLPQDPLSLMAATLIDSTISYPIFDNFHARETVICENQKTIKIVVYLTYQGKTNPYYTYTMPFNSEDTQGFTFDKQDEKTGMKNACRIINEEISPQLKGKDILGLKKIDEQLVQFQKKQSDQGVIIGENVIKSCSEALLYAYGFCTSPASPYQSIFKYLKSRDFTSQDRLPKLCFTILNGGKALNSKVKFSRIYLILDCTPQDDLDPMDIYLKIQTQIRKQITTHKVGENGFKPGTDGSFFNALENVNESFKFIEDAINATQINNDKKKYLKFGINPDIDSSFIREQNKYDIEGPKNLFDQDQMIEYYVKMCNEHPLMEYLEDPLAEGDVIGYQKFMKRFRDTMGRVKIGVKGWFRSNIDTIKHHTQIITKDDDDDDEQKDTKKEEEKKEEAPKEAPPQQQDTAKATRDAQGASKLAQQKGGNTKSQAKLEPVVQEPPPLLEDKNEPNKYKFIPHVIHLQGSQLKTSYKLYEHILYQQSLKQDEQYDLMIEDCFYENTNSEIVDFSVGSCNGYLNIKGFYRIEKTSKVARFNEIIDELRALMRAENQTA